MLLLLQGVASIVLLACVTWLVYKAVTLLLEQRRLMEECGSRAALLLEVLSSSVGLVIVPAVQHFDNVAPNPAISHIAPHCSEQN